ncbi:nuclease-related domain-containing protein [Streptomyces sp. NPDC101062]|uniref:nuclease-related domain-containing protein n=1 Tax=unclassified Streptomyces TaxID=2593676 RepID=UPI0038260D93
MSLIGSKRTGAGASAQRMADTIRADERRKQHRTAAWAVPLLVAPAAAGAAYLTTAVTSARAGVAVAFVITVLALRRLYRNGGSTWARGAAGERKTARILRTLVWCGLGAWAVIHDFRVGSKYNGDHLIIGRGGPVYVDTKTWNAKNARVTTDRHGRLWYGRYLQSKTIETVLWEAESAAQALGHPVRAVIAVHHAPVPRGGLYSGGVTIVQASELRRHLRDLPRVSGWNRARVASVYRLARRRLRPAA